ncbi:uncharacterized protein EI90DRAFT_3016680 [Cantharellus anzutake]|uniref:uncharacterized protein n=1 Tax=Cantharellus anzutake TaxID=1750568 RepID=UPI001905FBCB|nr:uncharacterized protein EI90DRAFT_3016680 [Cantharellus anzutake]KAF8330860.1 hypothetical protein EI90DRAFT_3016680 [Cantharellus anzutake]
MHAPIGLKQARDTVATPIHPSGTYMAIHRLRRLSRLGALNRFSSRSARRRCTANDRQVYHGYTNVNRVRTKFALHPSSITPADAVPTTFFRSVISFYVLNGAAKVDSISGVDRQIHDRCPWLDLVTISDLTDVPELQSLPSSSYILKRNNDNRKEAIVLLDFSFYALIAVCGCLVLKYYKLLRYASSFPENEAASARLLPTPN